MVYDEDHDGDTKLISSRELSNSSSNSTKGPSDDIISSNDDKNNDGTTTDDIAPQKSTIQHIYSVTQDALSSSTQASIPLEPMYLILNTAISNTWAFPSYCPKGFFLFEILLLFHYHKNSSYIL